MDRDDERDKLMAKLLAQITIYIARSGLPLTDALVVLDLLREEAIEQIKERVWSSGNDSPTKAKR